MMGAISCGKVRLILAGIRGPTIFAIHRLDHVHFVGCVKSAALYTYKACPFPLETAGLNLLHYLTNRWQPLETRRAGAVGVGVGVG